MVDIDKDKLDQKYKDDIEDLGEKIFMDVFTLQARIPHFFGRSDQTEYLQRKAIPSINVLLSHLTMIKET